MIVVLLVGFILAPFCLAGRSSRERYLKLGGSQPVPIPVEARGASLFGRALRELGYVEGKNIEYRSADNKLDRLPALADELVRLKVDVLLTPALPAALAAKNTTRTIPIV